MRRIFQLEGLKPTSAEFFVDLDISSWLDDNTISSVIFSAIDLTDGTNATSTVLNLIKSTNTNTVLKPFIIGGTSNHTYLVKIKVITNTGMVDVFGLQFTVYDY